MIKTTSLHFSYSGTTEALKGIDLSIKSGEFVAVVGHNGSGKSTLAKHFNGLLLPTSGSVEVDDLSTDTEEGIIEIRKRLGMVFQNPDNQIVAAMVEEDVAFALENIGVPTDEMRIRVDAALSAVGLSEYSGHSPHLLSGGQKQKVAIAGVLALRPDYIVLDEPTAMLDPKGRKDVMKTLCKLHQEGITIVLITHNMEEAALADRIVVMSDGKIYAEGAPPEIFSRADELFSLGLDIPQVTRLTLSLGLPAALSIEDACKSIAERFGEGGADA